MEKVVIYTDGACSGNPGPGGWGAMLMYKGNIKEISGGKKDTTNNVMELTAVIEGLKLLKYPCEVDLYSDSAYVVNAFLQGWIYNWVKNNWRTASKEPVKNKEIWQELYNLTKTIFFSVFMFPCVSMREWPEVGHATNCIATNAIVAVMI